MEQVIHGYLAAINAGWHCGVNGNSFYSTNYPCPNIFPTAGTIKNFRVSVDAAAGAGKSRTFTFHKNGAATSLAVTISDTETLGSDLVNSVSVSAGDYISIVVTTSGSPSSTIVRWSWLWEDSANDLAIMLGNRYASEGNTTIYLPPGWSSGGTLSVTTESLVQVPFKAGKLKNLHLRCYAAVAPGYTINKTMTVRVNGVDTALTLTLQIVGIGSYKEYKTSNTTDEVTVNDGDLVSIRQDTTYVSGSMPAHQASFSMTFDPDLGQAPTIQVVPNYSPSNVGVGYAHMQDFQTTGVSPWKTEAQIKALAGDMVIGDLHVIQSVAPGAGKSRAYMFRVNGADTGVFVTISDSETEGSISASADVNAGDWVAIETDPDGTPASTYVVIVMWQNLPRSPSAGGSNLGWLLAQGQI